MPRAGIIYLLTALISPTRGTVLRECELPNMFSDITSPPGFGEYGERKEVSKTASNQISWLSFQLQASYNSFFSPHVQGNVANVLLTGTLGHNFFYLFEIFMITHYHSVVNIH